MTSYITYKTFRNHLCFGKFGEGGLNCIFGGASDGLDPALAKRRKITIGDKTFCRVNEKCPNIISFARIFLVTLFPNLAKLKVFLEKEKRS